MAANIEVEDGGETSTFNILLGVTGSVAACKTKPLVTELLQLQNVSVKVVATEKSLHFFDRSSVSVKIFDENDEWLWQKRGDPVLHIELRRWADMFLIAPLDANTMAKLANGICDNLLTCVVRAWDIKKPLIYCPAMNTYMWQHPLTEKHLETLESLTYTQIPPISKVLMCRDVGMGAMAEVSTIVEHVQKFLQR